MDWKEEVDKVAGVETPTVDESLFKPKTGIDKKFLTIEEGGTMRTDIPTYVDKSLLKNVSLDAKGKQKVKEANNEMAWMTAVDKAFKEKASVKKDDSDWEKVVDKGYDTVKFANNTLKGINEAVNYYAGGMAGAIVGGTYSIGKTLLENLGKVIGDHVISRSNPNYKSQEVDWEANKAEGERLGQKVAEIPWGLFNEKQPTTPLGIHLTTPPKRTGGNAIKRLSQDLDPRTLVTAPAEIGREAMDLVNESWRVPKNSFLRHADTTVAEYAAYIIGGKAYKTIRQTAAEAFHKNAWDDLTPDQKQLVTVSLEDLISRGYSEAEVLRNWGTPELFAQSLARRNKGEGVITEPTGREPIVPSQTTPSTTPERAITFPTERAFAKDAPIAERVLPPPDRRPVAVSEPFKPGETPEPYTHKSDEVAPTGSAQAPKVTPDSPAKFMVREELKKKLADGSIKFPPRMEKTVEATTSAEGDIDESGWMDFVDEAAGIKKETTIPAVFKTMHIDDLKGFAEKGVVGARAEIAKRKVANTTEPIIESEMSKSDIRTEPIKEEVSTTTLSPNNYSPTDNIFNKPELKRNSTYAWRSMGESEFNKLMSGEKEYLGDKQASKGNFLAGIPESAGQFGGKGKFLVEFGGVKIAGDEGLTKGSKATVKNITKVWKFNDKASKWEEFPVSKGSSGSFSVANPVFSKATSERSSSKKGGKEVVTLTPDSDNQRVQTKGFGVHDRGIEESRVQELETIKVLKDLKPNSEEAYPYIEELGRKAYENGKRTWKEWSTELKSVLGDLWDKFEDFMKEIYYTAERLWKDDRGVIGFDINGEKVVKPRIIRRSELTKLNRAISKHEKIREKIQDEITELEGIGGKKSFERLKAIRLQKLEERIAKLKYEKAIIRAEAWSKAFEILKEKEYASHVAKLKTSLNRLDKTIDRLKEKAANSKDREDVKAPKVSVEDAEFITSMPDMKSKWSGRLFENPIYSLEEWGRAFNKAFTSSATDAVTKIKDLFYYPLRDAAHRADQHFANIFKKSEEYRKSLPIGSSKRIYMYALNKEKGGMDILKEMGYTEKDIPTLTPKEMEAYNWMRRGLEIMYDKINEARKASGMEQFGKVENYFTFGKDLSIAEILGFGLDDPRLMEFVHPKGTTFMYAKHRTGGLSKVKLDAFNIFNMYMQTATKHMYLSPEIARMRELIRKYDIENLNPDGSKYVTEWKASEQIPRAYSFLTDYLDFVSGKRKKLFPSSVEKALQTLSTNITMATLSGNIRSAGIQPTAIHNTYVEIGPKYTTAGLAGLFSDMRYIATQKSNVLFNREFDISVKPAMSGAAGAIGKTREAINKSWIGMRALKELDMQTATATWIGAYKKAIEFNKMPEKQAVRYADDVVVKTQASAARHDLAPIQRTAIGKFLTTFQTFVINNWNWLMKEVLGKSNESISNKKAVHKTIRYVVGAILINTFYENLLGINSPLPAPINATRDAYTKAEEKNKKARSEATQVNPYSRAAFAAGLEFLQLVPGLGNARFGSSFLGAPAEYLSDVSGKLAAEAGIYTGYEKPWVEILGKTVGLPGTTQLSKTIRYFEKKEKEEEKERKGGGKLNGLRKMKGLEGLK